MEWLDAIEETFDQTATGVGSPSKGTRRKPIGTRRDKRLPVLRSDGRDEGKSRHVLPVRLIHGTTWTKRRLSFALTPRSVAVPGRSCSMRSDWSSRNIARSTGTAVEQSED